IGNSLDLHEMLQSFIRVSTARLDLSSAHLFLFCNESKEPIHYIEQLFDSESPNASLLHYLSIPVQYLGEPWAKNEMLSQLVHEHVRQNVFLSVTFRNGKYYQSFSVPEHGVIVFESVVQIEPII